MKWNFPLSWDFERVGVTWDSMSFKNIDITKQVEIPGAILGCLVV